MKIAPIALLVSTAAVAQSGSTDFPAEAAPMAPEQLQAAVSGKVFSVKPASGAAWRWQFDPSGHFFINIGSFADKGQWSIKDSTLCSEASKIKYACNEIRAAGSDMYMKRDSGEVVRLLAQ